jgi:hypothetical protein
MSGGAQGEHAFYIHNLKLTNGALMSSVEDSHTKLLGVSSKPQCHSQSDVTEVPLYEGTPAGKSIG